MFASPLPLPSPAPVTAMASTPCKSTRPEKILVSVRVRPLSTREIAQQDCSAWECVDDRTILHRPPPPPSSQLPDRSPAHHQHPKSYTFDHVFGPDSVTLQVYEQGAKDVALSALAGINATIFAYGQTSSGKTYTMRGITENAIRDMYAYIEKHTDRDFVIKISAIEIYNEIVRDLLSTDSNLTPLRLMDDPEKGTKIEKLVEDVVRDSQHLQKILTIIEAQRQVGETMLNETSSRSHQIIRLTVESFPRGMAEGCGLVKSLVATLNLVDLAGSERASQTQSEGTRLKEGCHINRSLLTLTTIIRKLSGQARSKSSHLPYRDSKLTRILQNSLGGNARTAIICTMSPAQAHVEQSRNTLFFATQAKEVTNTAQVNMVVSDKDMVKMLQKEVARLEAELRVPDNKASEYSVVRALLTAKEAEIQQLRAEVKELRQQRDLAQTELENFRKRFPEEEAAAEDNKSMEPEKNTTSPILLSPRTPKPGMSSTDMVLCMGSTSDLEQSTPRQKKSPSEARQSVVRQSSAAASMLLLQEIKKLEQQQDELGEDANRALQALQKEVECLRLAQADMTQDAAVTISKLQEEIQKLKTTKAKDESAIMRGSLNCSVRGEINRLQALGNMNAFTADETIATLEEKLQNVQLSIDNMVLGSNSMVEEKPLFELTNSSCYSRKQSPRSTCRSLEFENNENEAPEGNENIYPVSHQSLSRSRKQEREMNETPLKENTPAQHKRNNSVDIKKMQTMFKTAAEENIRSIRTYVMDLKERVAKLQYQKQLLVCQVLELEANNNGACIEKDEQYVEDDDDTADMVEMDVECVTPPPQLLPTTPVPIEQSQETWKLLFQKERMQIAQLWDLCQVSIVHRSQFYLMFRGDPADQVYMEVELRRLAWLQEQFDAAASAADLDGEGDEDGETSLAASCRALRREREQLAKRMRTSLTEEEREETYHRWGVHVGGKQRKMQVAFRVWTNPHDEAHLQDSAELVAKVMGFWNPDKEASKEMFELAFAPPSSKKPWLQVGWNTIINNLNALNI